MASNKCEQCYEHQALNRNVFNYVKWKHRAQKSRQYLIMATIFMVTSLIGVVLFILLIAGVIRVKGNTHKVSISKEEFGITQGNTNIERFTLKSATGQGIELQVITLGCIITSIKVPDRNGHVDDVILGFDDLAGYQRTDNPYFGSILGRVANRIDRGRFTLNNQIYHLSINDGQNHLNGGSQGWHKAVWTATIHDDQLTFSHTSRDGDENYPGEIHANTTFTVTEDEIIVRFTAEIKAKPSPINMAIQPYMNLAGEGSVDIYHHEVTIFADKYLPKRDDHIPTGKEASVNQTLFDFSRPTNLGSRLTDLSNTTTYGYDDVFCVRGVTGRRLAARIKEPVKGRTLEIYTDQPAIHFYTGNDINIKDGKSHHDYSRHSGFALTPQNYPDAINQAAFPDSILYPGSTYIHTSWYKFSTST